MGTIWTIGELLVEIMRTHADIDFNENGLFRGPYPSGAPAIFIDTVARLGHQGGIIGGIGEDGFGQNLLYRLKKDGVNCEFINKSSNTTGVAFITYFSDGSRKYIFHIDNTAAVDIDIDTDWLVRRINSPDYFHLMGCSLMINKSFRHNIYDVLKLFKSKGARITFDPNIRTELLKEGKLNDIIDPILENCSILFPGRQELLLLTGEGSIDLAVNRLFDRLPNLEIIVLKKGKEGSTIFTNNNQEEIAPYQIKEQDPTGAGDCFDAGFLCGLLEGKSLYEAGQIASAVGALNAAVFGPMEGDISPEKVQEIISGS